MYITEISLSDYRKLGKIGYEEQKVENKENRTWHLETLPIGDPITDEDVEFSKTFKHKNIALFFNESPEDLVLDKFYVRRAANHCVWCGVEHIYSEKGRWFIKSDAECGVLSKRYFDKIYLIHVED